MQMPVPAGQPMRLPAQVAGALSRMQGQLQATHPAMQNAYAAHWLALRQAGYVPEFQRFTEHMLWAAYGNMALGGLLRQALSGRATPEVMAGVIDQLNLLQERYGMAAESLQEFLQRPEATELPAVQPMVAALQPIDQVWQGLEPARQMVTSGLNWSPTGPALDLPGIRAARIEQPRGGGAE